jgi:hypothetical protein
MVVVLASSTLFLASSGPVAAHSPTPSFGSPYYGPPGDGVSRRWISGGVHYGIDFLLRWTAVLAAADGNIEFDDWFNRQCHDESQAGCGDISITGFGLYVRINHGPADHPYRTYYGHLSVARTAGSVRKGEWIGTSGDSGWSTSPHLHFEVRHNGLAQTNAVNPDNEGGVSLWSDGEWSGTNPTVSVPAWQFPGLGYVAETVIDDDPNNAGGFTRGRDGTVTCGPHPDPNCPYWWRVSTAGYSSDYFWTYDNDTVADYWARWNPPSLPVFSNYRLSAYVPCEAGGASNNNFGSGISHIAWSSHRQTQQRIRKQTNSFHF